MLRKLMPKKPSPKNLIRLLLRMDSSERSDFAAEYGHDKLIKDARMLVTDTTSDGFNRLVVAGDASGKSGAERIAFVILRNSTPEPDGTHKFYWIRVDPRRAVYAETAIASTFRFASHGYQPVQET